MSRSRPRPALASAAVARALALGSAGLPGCDEAKDKAGDIVSSATAAAASAASAAQRKLDEVKDGTDATGEVKAGPTSTDGDRTVAEITATNRKDKRADYTVLVNFRDAQGNLLDSVVVSVDGVEPGATATGRARSNRSLSGDTTAQIGRALRH